MEFCVRSKQRLPAAHADVGSFRLRVLVFSGEGRLRSLLPRHVKLVWIQLGLPLRFALFYFFGHVPRLHQPESSGAGCHPVIDRPPRVVNPHAESSAILDMLARDATGGDLNEVFICDAVRTPFGRFGGTLSTIRTDDLAALPMRALMERNPGVDWSAVDDVIYGCANQAGEDNRNVARMALLLAGLPKEVPGATINRLCGSSLDALGIAARAIKSGETELIIAGGVESMTRAPFVTGKADSAFSRNAETFDTTIGCRFINPLMKEKYVVYSMPETEHVA